MWKRRTSIAVAFSHPDNKRGKESDGWWESIMWQWAHGSTGSDQSHMSCGVPYKSCTMLQTPDISIKTSYGPFKMGTHHEDHCKTPLQHMDSSKSSSGGVILLSCCDGSQVNYHRGVWARRNLTLKHAFQGAGGMPRVAWLLWVNQWEAERLWFYKMMDRAEGKKSHF